MIKKISFLVFLFLAVLGLGGCGRQDYLDQGGVSEEQEQTPSFFEQEEWVDAEEEDIDIEGMSDEDLLLELESMSDVYTEDISEIEPEL